MVAAKKEIVLDCCNPLFRLNLELILGEMPFMASLTNQQHLLGCSKTVACF